MQKFQSIRNRHVQQAYDSFKKCGSSNFQPVILFYLVRSFGHQAFLSSNRIFSFCCIIVNNVCVRNITFVWKKTYVRIATSKHHVPSLDDIALKEKKKVGKNIDSAGVDERYLALVLNGQILTLFDILLLLTSNLYILRTDKTNST